MHMMAYMGPGGTRHWQRKEKKVVKMKYELAYNIINSQYIRLMLPPLPPLVQPLISFQLAKALVGLKNFAVLAFQPERMKAL